MNFADLETALKATTGSDADLDKRIAATLKVKDRDFTSSVEACIDLVHEKLPHAHWHVGRSADGAGLYALLEDGRHMYEAEAATVPLALLVVIVQGLRQHEAV